MLREYIQCFTKVTLEVPSTIPEILTSTFSQGLREENFRSLIKKAPLDYNKLLKQAEKYTNVEEAQWLGQEQKVATRSIEREMGRGLPYRVT